MSAPLPAVRWQAWLLRIYDSLTRTDSVQPADLLFVMAGRMERKPYGLELYRAGVAPRLVLSVGRFEVSKMGKLDLGGLEELIALRDKTRPGERHFFVSVDAAGIRIDKVRVLRWSTYGEALALHQFLKWHPARTVTVISTDVHLRRVALTFAKVFRNSPVEFRYCPVPSRFGFVRKDRWWTRPGDRWFVIQEMIKLGAYAVILSTPPWAVRRLMRINKSDRG
jgi:uncharacterized SAM-binding protein YcdF (DUF218 family)